MLKKIIIIIPLLIIQNIYSFEPSSLKGSIIPYSWLGSASFGSFSVGKQVLYGMCYLFQNSLDEAHLEQFAADDIVEVKKIYEWL